MIIKYKTVQRNNQYNLKIGFTWSDGQLESRKPKRGQQIKRCPNGVCTG